MEKDIEKLTGHQEDMLRKKSKTQNEIVRDKDVIKQLKEKLMKKNNHVEFLQSQIAEQLRTIDGQNPLQIIEKNVEKILNKQSAAHSENIYNKEIVLHLEKKLIQKNSDLEFLKSQISDQLKTLEDLHKINVHLITDKIGKQRNKFDHKEIINNLDNNFKFLQTQIADQLRQQTIKIEELQSKLFFCFVLHCLFYDFSYCYCITLLIEETRHFKP
jgi:hypothetical protein